LQPRLFHRCICSERLFEENNSLDSRLREGVECSVAPSLNLIFEGKASLKLAYFNYICTWFRVNWTTNKRAMSNENWKQGRQSNLVPCDRVIHTERVKVMRERFNKQIS
jgi:hypothetical protein